MTTATTPTFAAPPQGEPSGRLAQRLRAHLPLLTTCLVFLLLYGAASIRYRGFFSVQVAANLISDNAFLGIACVGLTLVILSGGIDLSVGAAIGCTSIFVATMIERHGWHPALAAGVVLMGGILLGLAQGMLIHFFELSPFLITLGGLFFCRGLGLLISRESVAITNPIYVKLSSLAVPLGFGATFPLVGILFLALLALVSYVAAFRPIGRYVYAVGGSEQSALLMGLPVGRTKIGVYAFAGFCSALAGLAATLYTSSGNALTGSGLELDAIAAVVIGGTLLSGGVGGPIGTLLGILIFGVIQSAITFEGTLSSWWARIAIGILLLGFIFLQKLLQTGRTNS
jgi:galactofuranose transport system permease protein